MNVCGGKPGGVKIKESGGTVEPNANFSPANSGSEHTGMRPKADFACVATIANAFVTRLAWALSRSRDS